MTLDAAHPPEAEQSFICVMRIGRFCGFGDKQLKEKASLKAALANSVLFSLGCEGLEDPLSPWTVPSDHIWTKGLRATEPPNHHENNMIVYVEKKVLEDPAIVSDENFGPVKRKFCTFREDYDDISNQIDFIICLGGDGTLLYASSLFQGSVPPVMAFHLGSLGFLTPFNFENFQSQVNQVIEGNAAVILRSRLKVRVVKELRDKKIAIHNGLSENGLDTEGGKQAMQYQVLNEVVIDRGPSSYLSNVDVYLDGHLITTVQGDGVIVSTPTGSTAYAAAAGASMVHPNVPAIMVTPICPHSLSFRPIVVPAGVELKIMLSPEARNTAWVSFDGRKRQEIRHGDSISITTSCYPLPSICVCDPVSDWFESLAQCLHWNVRKKQAHFPEDEDEDQDEEDS
ncbi:hypothetical protein STEG23_018736 [Scotinomys teguina]